MKRSKTSSRKVRASKHRSLPGSVARPRRRPGDFRLEALEERTLLSGTQPKFPPPDFPLGLGLAYRNLSERAHGVGSSGQNGAGASGTPVTMAELDAYLKQLQAAYTHGTNAGAGLPVQYAGRISPEVQAPYPLSSLAFVTPDDGGDPLIEQDDLETERTPVGSVSDPASLLWRLSHVPSSTGFSTPPLLPTVISGFEGMNFLDSLDGYVPPDTDVAVGPQFAVETVNAQIQVYDKATGTALLPNTPLNQFFGQPSESPYDAVVSYDDAAGRFVVAAPTFNGNLLLAVSKDANPLDGFSTYDLNVTENGNLPDYPKIGFNADEVVITFNMYDVFGTFSNVQVLSFSAGSIFSNPPSLSLGTDYFSSDRTSGDFTLAPASMHGATPGMPMYFVEENSYGDGNNLRVVSASDLLSDAPSYSDAAVAVPTYTEPPPATQPGGSTIGTGDSRILDADWRDGTLVAAQNVGLLSDANAHARWYELDVSGAPTLADAGTISGPAADTNTYFPAVAIGPGGVIGMVYNESSPGENPSVYVTGRSSADPLGTMESPRLARAGDAPYSDFAGNLWGNYNGIGVDPTDGSFWGAAEYSTALLSGDPANWATYIAHFQLAPSVVSSTPAAGSVVTTTPPTTFSLTFTEPIDPSSITASDFKVNGVPADSASISADGLTITYTYNTSPVTQQGDETMSLPEGAVKGLGDQAGNAAFSANFLYVQTQLEVTGTSPAVGSVLAAPVTDIVVQFNKAFDPYSVSSSDFQVSQGAVVSAVPLTSKSIDLTLSGVTQDGTLTLTLPDGAILDDLGVGNVAFTGTYSVDIASTPYPTPLMAQPPAGSLIYDPSVSGSIGSADDTDTYTLSLAANQSVSLVLNVDPGLVGTLALVDPGGNTVGTATGAAAGSTVVLQAGPVAQAGTYSFVVGGAGGTTGGYTLQAILNAVYKQSTDPIHSIGSAMDLSGAFTPLGTTPAADRAGVVGVAGPGGSTDYYAIYLNAGESATIAAAGQGKTPVSLGLLDAGGNLLALPPGVALAGPLDFTGGFGGASGQLTLNGFANLGGGALNLSDGGFFEAASAFSNNALDVTAFQTSFNFQVLPAGSDPLADGFTFTIQGVGPRALGVYGGDLGYAGIGNSVAIKFDYFDNAGEGTDSTGLYTDGQDPYVPAVDLTGTGVNLGSGDPMNVAMSYDGATLGVTITDTITGASASQSYGVDIPSIIGGGAGYVGFTGGTGGLTSIPSIESWSYTPSRSVIGAQPFEAINNFVAPASGWYFAAIGGSAGNPYDVVVTRDADFTLHGSSFDTAQPLDGTGVVLGAIVQGGGGLQALDLQGFSFSNIYQTDPVTGAFGSSFLSPTNDGFYLFGQNMASDGTYTYYSDGFGGTGNLFKLDSTGAVVASTTGPNSDNYSGLAYLHGKLYAAAPQDSNIYIYDADSLAFLGTITNTITDSALVGLAGDPDRNVLWGVGQTGGVGALYEIDPSTGATIREAPDNNQGSYEQDIAYADGMLIVSEVAGTAGPGGIGALDEYDPDTLGYLQRVTPPYQYNASGLAGDGLGGVSSDWYRFNVNAGDNLVLTTTTPGGTSANGEQFANDLTPTINLYDQAGNLVASATGNADDGRNDVIVWTALTSGSYRVQITGADKDDLGEYTIAIQGATGGNDPFTVTSTTPAAGSDINFQPSTMTVVVSDSILLSSVSPSDLTVDGQDATGVTVIDDHTLSFALPALADGTHSVSIGGLLDLQGVPLTPDSFSFAVDTSAPYIVSSSIVDGDTFGPAPQDITEVLTFSEPMNTSISPSIDLLGEIRGKDYKPSSASWDPTGTVLTIVYANLPSDAYQFNAFPNGFQDLAGNPLAAGLTVNFSILGGTSAFVGLQPVQPLGSLVYQGSVDNVLVDANDVDTYTLSIDPGQTLAVVVRPVTKSMTATVQLYAPTGNLIGTAVSPSAGAPAVLSGVQSSKGGTYQIKVSGGPGEYAVEAVLNAFVDPAAYGGTPNGSIATAQPIDPYANKFAGDDTRTAVLGGLSGGGGGSGLVSTDRFSQGLYSVDATTGAATLLGYLSYFTSFSGMAIDPSSGTTYISDVGDPNTGLFSLATIDRATGQETIIGPQFDPTFGEYDTDIHALVMKDGTLYGFSYTRGLGVMDPSTGTFTPSLPSNSMPETIEDATIGPDGTVYAVGQVTGSIYSIDVAGATATYLGNPNTGDNTLIGLAFSGGSLYELGYTDGDPNTPLWQIDPSSITGVSIGPNGQESQPDAMTAPLSTGGGGPVESSATYSFALNQGQSATIVLQSLNNRTGSFALFDDEGNLIAESGAGATNYTQGLNDFVAPSGGTYYVQVSGDPGLKFNLVVTRGADFITQPNSTPGTAQDITPTQGSGDPNQGGVLGYLSNPSGVLAGSNYEGIDFNGSNCGCLPPDTNAAVGGDWIVETVNLQIRVLDKATGTTLLDEPLSQFFASVGGALSDPYVEYDTIADRWYVAVINNNGMDVNLAVSNDSNPLDGFNAFDVPSAAGSADFPKFGYNADAIVIEANDFGDGHSVVTAVDKAQALAGNLVYYQSTPSFNFRALTPAQMHGAQPGDPMWFMASTGDPTYDGTTPSTIRVTKMEDVLSDKPIYTDYTVNVNTYGSNSGAADQPGAPGSVATNDVTTTQVDYLDGSLVTAFSASTPADGFKTTKALWYQVDVTSGTPVLVQQGVVDPGPGVATFFPSATQDAAGNIGITYMQSSANEYVSSYVAGHIAGTPLGTTTPGVAFAPGAGPMPASFREGDYSTVVLDPTDGMTFWAANEYAGPDAGTDIWNTRIGSFTLFSAVGTDYYSVNANAGDRLHFATTTPAGGPNEFVNDLYPELLLYDPNGNLVAIANGNAADGRNSAIDFTVPDGDAGQWIIEVTASPSTPAPTQGEYGLLATGATGSLAPFVVTGADPAPGSLVQPPSTITITFDHPVNATTLTPGELEVNGVPATAVMLVGANSASWTIPPDAYGTGVDLANVVTIGADASGNQIADVSGATLIPFSYTFFTTNVAPTVVSSSVDGQVFSPAPADVTEVVTFSQPMDTSFTTAASFDLLGQYRNQHYAAASFTWDPTGTILTIDYANLPDDVYTLTLFASGFQNTVGIPLASDYTASFAVALGSASFPTPLASVPPLGDLIYTGSDSHVLVTPTDVDSLGLPLNAGGTLTLVATPTTSSQQLTITVVDPDGNAIATATATAAGAATYLETVPVDKTGTYQIRINDAGGAPGLYSIQAYLNTVVKQGTSNDTLGSATDLSGSSYILGPGNADRVSVVGSLPSGGTRTGDVFVASRDFNLGTASILHFNESGQLVQAIPVNEGLGFSVGGVELSPYNNMLYVGVTTSDPFDSGNPEVTGELVEYDPSTGEEVATIPLPSDPWVNGNPNFYYYYPYSFAAATDGTFWISQPNSGNIIHVDDAGNLLASYATGIVQPYSPSVRADGQVYFTSDGLGDIGLYLLNPGDGTISLLAPQSSPQYSTIAGTGGVWSPDYNIGAERFDDAGNLLQVVGYYGSTQAQTDPDGNVWVSNYEYSNLSRFDPSGNLQLALDVPGATGLTVWGVDNPTPQAQDTEDFYKFDLSAGQSATIVGNSLNSLNLQITLLDGDGNVLATGVGGSSNVTQKIENYVAATAGTYYVEVTGDAGVKYSLTVTRGANFDIEPNNSPGSGQSLNGTNGVLGASSPGGNLTIGTNINGIDFSSPNNPCGCLPPDTNAAVGPDYIGEAVNLELRFWDRQGNLVFSQDLPSFFASIGGTFSDPYIEYDSGANRWYITSINTSDESALDLAVSVDSNPLDGWYFYLVPSAGAGNGADFEKMGYNADAIVLEANSFGSGQAQVTVVDKAQALAGNLVYYQSIPSFQFRALVPAQMNDAKPGDPMWFMAADGDPTYDGTTPDTIRVTKMTNYLSNSPVYTDYAVTVDTYGPNNGAADQPGGPGSVATNDVTATQVVELNGKLATAFSASTPADGFQTTKAHWYEVDVSGGTPVLVLQGVIDPGPGVATFFPSVAIDTRGNLGFTWMESSSSEYVSMWIGTRDANSGNFTAYDAAPGQTFMNYSFREGDYSSILLDPVDGTTFWAANEFAGPDPSVDIWNTQITSFSLPPAVDDDWYSVNVQAGQSLELETSTPSDQGGQFVNTESLEIELYDTFGNLVAVGTKQPDGRNVSLFFNAPVTGAYSIRVFNDPGASGEYYLSAATSQYPAGGVTGRVFNDLDGDGSNDGGSDPGLAGWEVDVFDSDNNFVASRTTDASGDFNFQGLAPGTYTIAEVLKFGWSQTTPPDYVFTVAVSSGGTVSGLDFGNFQDVNVTGSVFNDLTGSGNPDPGDPGLSGWTVDLLDASDSVVATTTSDASGNYAFDNIGPGSYTVQEELQPGWIQTFPAPPGTYSFTAASGNDQGGLSFGNFQLVTLAGTVYNDLDGNGQLDPGDPGLSGWTVNLLDSGGSLIATTTSDASGNYAFDNLGPGVYTIAEVNQAGWYQTQPAKPPGTYTEQAISGANATTLNFGNFQLVSVSGEVYNDLNGNGTKDPGDPGLSGWTVDLLNASDSVVATTTSDANGNYAFDGLFPGTYSVEELLQPNWTQTQPTNPSYYSVTTQSGLNRTGLNFGNQGNFESLSGVVYSDRNADGHREPGDYGLKDVLVSAYDPAGNLVASTRTAVGGTYSFTDLPVQTYTIVETPSAGWIITQPTNPPGTYTVPGGTGSHTGLNFGNFRLVTISGNVYNDLNGNGTKDPGDPNLKGWTVDLFDEGGNLVDSLVTNGAGNYTFHNVGPGTYTVAEELKSGWMLTQPTSGFYTVTTSSSTNIKNENFGNTLGVSLSGNVYNDKDGDGTRDPGDPGLGGWTIDLYDEAGNLVGGATTGSSGDYEFATVLPGNYSLVEVTPSGWVVTQPAASSYTISTSGGQSLDDLDFGNFQLVSISGNVYNDQNGDGQKNGGDPALQDWTINLLDAQGNVVDSTTSDSGGKYRFTNVGPGTFTVAETVQADWVQTHPLYPVDYTVTTQGGHNVSGLQFGDHASPAIDPLTVVDNGQTGYSETGSWSTATGGYNGSNRVARTTHGSGPTATATWSFDVPSGQYDVYITYAGKSSYSKAAPFSVTDGTFDLGTVNVDESILVTQSHAGMAEGSYGGVGWLLIGTFGSSTGNLQVRLSNLAQGNSVDADGVLIVPHASSSSQTASTGTGAGGTSSGSLQGGPAGTTHGGTSPATPTVRVSGVSQPSPLSVVYSQGSAPVVNQPAGGKSAGSAVALDDGLAPEQPDGEETIAALALNLLSGKKKA
jgi:protocatechuate 3,4-dioxygenase beta subunit/methionine-rich copper-binding protein CopC